MNLRKNQLFVWICVAALLWIAIGFGTVFAQDDPIATATEEIVETETELPTESPEPVDTEIPTETEEPIVIESETPEPTETELPVETEEPSEPETEMLVPTEPVTPDPTETATPTATDSPVSRAPLITPILRPYIRINSTQIKLHWEPVADAIGYRVYTAETPSGLENYPKEYVTSTNEYTLDVTSLDPIYYQVVAFNNDEDSPKSAVGIATAAIIAAPEIRSVSADSATTIKLVWKAVPGVTGYRIWRSEVGPSSGYGWIQNIGKVTELTVSVPSNRTYYFRIAGFLGDETGPLSVPVSGSTAAVILTQPTIQSITRVSDLKVRLSWSAVPGATGYKIWRAAWKDPNDFSWSTTVGNVTQAELSVPRIGFYNFKIAATLDTTEGPQSSVSSVTTAILNKSHIWLIDNRNPNVLCVYWEEIPNATGYRIWRSETGPNTGYSWVKTIERETYTDCIPVTLQEPYYFKVAPMSGTIQGPQSEPVAGSMDGIDLTAPILNPPVRVSERQIRLSWTPVFGAVGYEIHRNRSNSSNDFSPIKRVYSETSFIIDEYPDETIRIKVRALRGGGIEGPFSNTVTINMASAPIVKPTMNAPTVVSNTVLRLSWNAVPGATGYRIWRSTTSANAGFTPLGVTGANVLATTTGIQTNQTYYYKVQAMFSYEDGPLSAAVSGKTSGTALGRPTIQSVTPVSQNAFKVTWSAVPGVSEYRVWRSESANSGYSATWLIKNQTSIVTSVPATKTYYYKVAAVSGSTIGPVSAPVSGSTAFPRLNPIGNVADGKFVIRWSAVPGAVSYRLYRSETAATHGYGWSVNMGSSTATVTSVPDLNKRYYYKVVAVYPDGSLSPFSSVESKVYNQN